jgi:A/G-specific adenine glycosylase
MPLITKKEKGLWFREQLMQWHREQNRRALPWKGLKDPYKIWLSEIILQQTRAEQGLPYYHRFVDAYPTILNLAAATEEEVFRHWQGLGYYSRARNLHHTARFIANELAGNFPDSYEGLLKLKGIGVYTAAAIASFAFGLPHAVVDGNVVRVLSRFCGIDLQPQSTEGKKKFAQTANNFLDTFAPGAYNQAIMDHGATVCTPVSPACERCPVGERCTAFNKGLIHLLPAKAKKAPLKNRYFHYLLFQAPDNTLWVRRRVTDIWSGLYEPFLIEAPGPLDRKGLVRTEAFQGLRLKGELNYEGELVHLLTHQRVTVRFFTFEVPSKEIQMLSSDGIWASRQGLTHYAFPRPLVLFFENKSYF